MGETLSIKEVTTLITSALAIIESKNNDKKNEEFIQFITENQNQFMKPIKFAGNSIIQYISSSTENEKCVSPNNKADETDCNFCVSGKYKYLLSIPLGQYLHKIKSFIITNKTVLNAYKCLFKDYYLNKNKLGWTAAEFAEICENNDLKIENNLDCSKPPVAENQIEDKTPSTNSTSHRIDEEVEREHYEKPQPQSWFTRNIERPVSRIIGAGKRKTRKSRKSTKSKKSRKSCKRSVKR